MSVSSEHEVRVQLFKERPEMAPELLSQCFGVQLPLYDRAAIQCADLGSALPVERRADAVVALLDTAVITRIESHDVTEMVIVVEVQNRIDPVKWRRWAEYSALCGGRELCPVVVLAVCPDSAVAADYDRWFEVGPYHRFRPLVLGPDRLPAITDPEQVAVSPELAVLAAAAHAHVPGVLKTLADGFESIPPEKAVDYTRYALTIVDEHARTELEAYVKSSVVNYHTEYSDRLREEGREDAARRFLVEIAERRGLELDASQRSQIEECSDCDDLERWRDRAWTASTAAEIFE